MKKLILILGIACISFCSNAVYGQVKPVFTGAKAVLKHYKALYVLNSGEDKKINGTLRNMNNALEDPRLKGKLEMELIVFGDGVVVFDQKGPYGEKLRALQKKGVLLVQCMNTLQERKIEQSSLYDFISFAPSGNGEIIIRQQQGWAVIHP